MADQPRQAFGALHAYPSSKAACEVIDRHFFADHDRHHGAHHESAGTKIWGSERTSAALDAANNCKDPAYR